MVRLPICKKSRNLLLPVSRDCFALLFLTVSICLRTKLNFFKHLRKSKSEKSLAQRFDVAMTSLSSGKDKNKNWHRNVVLNFFRLSFFSLLFPTTFLLLFLSSFFLTTFLLLSYLSVSFNFSTSVTFSVLITYLTDFCSLLNLGKKGISFSWYRNKLPRLYTVLLLI